MSWDLSNAVFLYAIDVQRHKTLRMQCKPGLGNPSSAVVEVKRAFGPSPSDPSSSFASAETLTLDGTAMTEIDVTDEGWVHVVCTTGQSGVTVDMDFTLHGEMSGEAVSWFVDMDATGEALLAPTLARHKALVVARPTAPVSTGAIEIKQAIGSTFPKVAFSPSATLTLDGATITEIDTSSAGVLLTDRTAAQSGLGVTVYAYLRDEVTADSVTSSGGGTSVEVARFSVSATTGGFTTTATTVPFDRTDQAQSWASNSSGVVTLNPGTYLIHADVTIDESSGNNRTEFLTKVQENSGGSYADMPGTDRRHYSRNNNQGANSTTSASYLVVGTTHEIRVQSQRASGSNTGEWIADGSALTICKIA